MKAIAPLALLLGPALFATDARGEAPDLFAAKPYVFRQTEKDRRFPKTLLAKALAQTPSDAACARVAASFLMGLAEAAPYFHKKDDRFMLFPGLVAPLESPRFPAGDYLVHLLRRVAIDGKAPESYLSTARDLKERFKAPIDLARLAYAVDGLQPIDSMELTLGALLRRYDEEVHLAPSIAKSSALDRFQDRYLDRDVAWDGLLLADIRKTEPRRMGPKGELRVGVQATFLVPMAPKSPTSIPFFEAPKPDPVRIRALLAPDQYLDLKATVRSAKYVVRGRLWSFQAAAADPDLPSIDIELREAIVFEDHDWSHYPGFASKQDCAICEACRNDLSPLGLKERQGLGPQDGFGHP